MNRVGPQMRYLASRVREGDSILALVRRAYTTRRRGVCSIKFGYEAVHRAIRAGLIDVLPSDHPVYPAPRGQYRLAPVKAIGGDL